jgi:hypothetical protein
MRETGNQTVVSRATKRSRLDGARMRGRATGQSKSKVIKAGTDKAIRISKFHVTGNPTRMKRTTKYKISKPTKRIKIICNNRIDKPIRRKRGIKGPRSNNPEDPRKKNSM